MTPEQPYAELDAQIQTLCDQVAQQSTTAREELILLLSPLAEITTHSCLQGKPPAVRRNYEDLRGVALLTVVTCVNQVFEGALLKETGFRNYVVASMWSDLADALSVDALIPIPRRTRHRHNYPNIVVQEFDGAHTDPTYDPDELKAVDLYHDLMSLCELDVEREVLELRAEGYSFVQIAEKLDISKSTVGNLLKAVRQRYEHYHPFVMK